MEWTSLFTKPIWLQLMLVAMFTAGAMVSAKAPDTELAFAVLEADTTMQGMVEEMGKEAYLRVMTFNIQHGKGMDGRVDLVRIMDEIKLAQPDVVALQEVDRFQVRSWFTDQVKVFSQELKMDAFFSPSLYVLGFAEYGNAILSKYPLHNKQIELLPGEREQRAILSAEITVGDYQVTIMTTHLGVLQKERDEQMPLIMEKLNAIEDPAVLMGDMNMEDRNPLLQALSEPWTKAELVHPMGTVMNGGEIDHIYTGPFVNAINAWTIQSKASDHLPVVAELSILKD